MTLLESYRTPTPPLPSPPSLYSVRATGPPDSPDLSAADSNGFVEPHDFRPGRIAEGEKRDGTLALLRRVHTA